MFAFILESVEKILSMMCEYTRINMVDGFEKIDMTRGRQHGKR